MGVEYTRATVALEDAPVQAEEVVSDVVVHREPVNVLRVEGNQLESQRRDGKTVVYVNFHYFVYLAGVNIVYYYYVVVHPL